ncbi:hypothetical protein GCM10010466_20810 [Planomonospora alba]|uniref:Uncharacterized protein n=1 Tax=Planomonospora alba TaxID=161354 RepID=A0ABP6MXU1_9ACTN
MIKKTVRRLIAVGAVAPAIALGASGTALADDGALWERTQAQASINGASMKIIRAYTDGSGKVLFEEVLFTADRNGASIRSTTSGAGPR